MPENVQSSTPKGVKPKDGDATSDDGLDYDEEFKPLKSLPDVHVEVTEGKLSENSKTKGRKIYKKLHFCPYCNVRQEQVSRHCKTKHKQMPDVQKILAAGKNTEEKSRLTTLLKNRGNFLHNIAVLKAKKGTLLVVRRPDDNQTNASRFLPCGSCLGFYSRIDLWRHKCVGKDASQEEKSEERQRSMARESRVLLQSSLESDNPELATVLATMIKDEVTAVVKEDRLIRKFANDQLELHDNEKPHLVRGKARDLGRLLIHLKKNNKDLEDCGLESFLIPDRFDLVVSSVKQLATAGTKEAKSLPLKLGQEIKILMAILIGESIRSGNEVLKDRSERFLKLYDAEWSRRVSLKARKKLYDGRLNKAHEIPDREDVVTFGKALVQETIESEKEFLDNPGKNTGRRLLEAVLIGIICFNKRRGGEAARIEVKVYKEAETVWKNIDYNSELFGSLPDDQVVLAKNHFQCLTIGKKGRHVPIILTLGMKARVDLLIKNREKVGLTERNRYIFGIPGKESHLRPWDILRSFCDKFGTNNLTSTSLRRYLATSLQGNTHENFG